MKYHGEQNPYNVDALWETRLRPEIVAQIREAAHIYKTTMSWVVRYCVFKLYRKKKISSATLHDMAAELREKNQPVPIPASKLHRLRLCLYGDDERILLELKYRFRLTTTMLIRIALVLYLKQLLSASVAPEYFFFYGLKFFANTAIKYSRKRKIPHVDFHIKSIFAIEDYWGRPFGFLPEFLIFAG